MRSRPDALSGTSYCYPTPIGTAFITINGDRDGPFEVFINIGKVGSDVAAMAEGLGRSISLGLREGVSPREYIDQLHNIGGVRLSWNKEEAIPSLPHAVSRALERYMEEHNGNNPQ